MTPLRQLTRAIFRLPGTVLIAFALALFFSGKCAAQNRIAPIGIFIRTGTSMGINSAESSMFSQTAHQYRYLTAGFGIYSFIRISKGDTTNSLKNLIQYLKVDLTLFSVKEGAFDLGTGQPISLATVYREVSLSLPLTYRVAPTVNGYVAFGFNGGFRSMRIPRPDQVPADLNLGSSFKGGISLEAGFMLPYGSCLCIRSAREFSGDYPYNETTIYFGFCPLARKKSRK